MKSTNKNIYDIIKNIDKKCIRQQIIDVLIVGDRILLQADECSGCTLSTCLCGACKYCSVCTKRCPCSDRGPFDFNKLLQSISL